MAPAQEVPARHWSLRLSIPKTVKENVLQWALLVVPKLQAFFQGNAEHYICQVEDTKPLPADAPEDTSHTHNMHIQCYLNTGERKRTTALLKLIRSPENDWAKWSMKLSKASAAGITALKSYAMKEESRMAGPWADKKIYLGADLINKIQFTRDQLTLHNYMKNIEPSKRYSFWVYCPKGGSGKSAILKWLCYHYGWPAFTWASAKDILYLVSEFQGKRAYMINLGKTKPADVSNQELYAAIEGIKDGMFTSTKYKPKMVMQAPAHVVVFSNQLPNPAMLTRCRIKIIQWKPLPRHLLEDHDDFDWGQTTFIDPSTIEVHEDGRCTIPDALVMPMESES